MRKIATWIIKALVVVLLIDGVIDFGHYGWGRLTYSLSTPPTTAEGQEAARARQQLRFIAHPGGAHTMAQPAPAFFSADPDGLRHSPNIGDDTAKPHLMLLGASTIFGWANSADNTLSATLARLLPDWAIDNAAAPGMDSIGAMQNFQYALPKRHPKVAILAGGIMDVVFHCDAQSNEQRLNLVKYPVLVQTFMTMKNDLTNQSSCVDGANLDFLTDRILYDIEAAQQFSASRNIGFAFVLHPFPRPSSDASTGLSRASHYFTREDRVSKVVERLRQRLRDHPNLNVIDLADAFVGHPEYFSDHAGHFTAAGTAFLADKIVAALDKDWLAAYAATPSPLRP